MLRGEGRVYCTKSEAHHQINRKRNVRERNTVTIRKALLRNCYQNRTSCRARSWCTFSNLQICKRHVFVPLLWDLSLYILNTNQLIKQLKCLIIHSFSIAYLGLGHAPFWSFLITISHLSSESAQHVNSSSSNVSICFFSQFYTCLVYLGF